MPLFQESKAAREQLTEARLKRISQEGRPGFIDQTLGRGAYMAEYKKSRDAVNRQYSLQKRAFRKEWHKKEEDLQHNLGEKEHEIYEERYRIGYLTKNEDPRLERMQTMADKTYGLISDRQWRQFLRDKTVNRKALSKQRKENLSKASHKLQDLTKSSELRSLKSPSFGGDPRAAGMPTPHGSGLLQ